MFLISFLTGVFSWTFAEYMLHRFLGHEHKGKNLFKTEHHRHHGESAYFAPAYLKALAALMVCSVLMLTLTLLFAFIIAIGFTSGFILMYSVYEITHYRYHASKPIPFFIPLRKHHFYHHFHQPKTNYGVTTRFWDKVFGTYVEVEEEVRVPSAMTPRWLLDNEQRLKAPYRLHFRIVGKRKQ